MKLVPLSLFYMHLCFMSEIYAKAKPELTTFVAQFVAKAGVCPCVVR